ncbi:hypothetical protein [Mangrovibacillus cuniculi]|uniref:Lipoprotein n=1 Tax=Mangrovibacillus cuniculi TaxID=2593652 RepID=A0A7S8HEN1_9BACI|nr:hypothetical protein [Mangrovibacillus cuniculi]QPC45892.1 hypothetical protein G8O30_02420 [Mangrovibacillus cuniculi]
MRNKWFLALSISLACIFITACSEESAQTTAIKDVLQAQFSAPDLELAEIISEMKQIDSETHSVQKLDEYNKNVYGNYFVEDAFVSFIGSNGYAYAQTATMNNHTLNLENVEITQDKDFPELYNFVADVIVDKDTADEVQTEVEGKVSFSKKEEDKIEAIKYTNDNGLSEVLR